MEWDGPVFDTMLAAAMLQPDLYKGLNEVASLYLDIRRWKHKAAENDVEYNLTDVKRDVTVDIDTSGDINVDQVGGSFTVKTDGSGEISHERVVGAVTVPDRH